jgi:hypothetical protein
MLSRRAAVVLTAGVAIAEVAFSQGYGGPSILSRGGNRPGQRGRAPTDIVVYGGVRGTVDTGLTPVLLEEDGTIATRDVYGVQAEIGAYGTHSWRRTILGLDYRGDYRKTTRKSGFNGTNQALSLDLQHQINARVSIFFRETAGTTNRAFGGFAAPVHTDLSSLNLANDEVFDTRVYFNQTSAGVALRRSARTTFVFIGDGFFVKRPDPRLVGVAGYRATGAVNYRTSSRTTIGGSYQYMMFDFPRAFGGSEMHGPMFTATHRLTRNLELSLAAGFLQLHSFGTQSVTLSPEVAALLGRTTGVEAFTRDEILPQVFASAAYAFERSRFTASFLSGVTPGNGVFQTSQRNAGMVGYSFTGIRKLSLGASARYAQSESKSINVRNVNNTSVGGGINYSITRLVNLNSQLDYRTFRTGGIRGREGFAFTLGLLVSPAKVPISIW